MTGGKEGIQAQWITGQEAVIETPSIIVADRTEPVGRLRSGMSPAIVEERAKADVLALVSSRVA